MRAKPILIVASLVAAACLIGWLAVSGDKHGAEVNRLARKAAQAEMAATSEADPDAEFAALAAEGKGQRVPDHLEVHPSPDKMYWFVGKKTIESGVEVPFAPGRLPTPVPQNEPLKENPGFVGANGCKECHRDKHSSFVHTAHHLTSQIADIETVDGSFQPGPNRMKTSDPDVHYTMIQRDDRIYQRVFFHGWRFEVPFDLISGSSKMAQAYLYWHGDQLYQMNVNHLTDPNTWINSPGYIDGDAAYARPVPVRCMECHVTYLELREQPNHYTPNSLILGISCERCHGPGKQHIEFHRSNPDEKKAKFVTNPNNLTRIQQLDICGQCHNGSSPLKGDAFQFRPGDRLSDHYHPSTVSGEANSVHTSNQQVRMATSECYKQSEMTCASCHNPHENERGQMKLFSDRCLQCHDDKHCGMLETVGPTIIDNCVDCHMPKRAGNFLKMNTAEGTIFPPLRDHYVRIDDLATREFLKKLRDAANKEP